MHSGDVLRSTDLRTMESQANYTHGPTADTLASDKSEAAYAEVLIANEEELRNMQQEFTKHHNPIIETVRHAKTAVLALYWEESDMEGLVQEVGSTFTRGSNLSFCLIRILERRHGLAGTDGS